MLHGPGAEKILLGRDRAALRANPYGDLMPRTVETRHRAMHIGSVRSVAVLLNCAAAWAGHASGRYQLSRHILTTNNSASIRMLFGSDAS